MTHPYALFDNDKKLCKIAQTDDNWCEQMMTSTFLLNMYCTEINKSSDEQKSCENGTYTEQNHQTKLNQKYTVFASILFHIFVAGNLLTEGVVRGRNKVCLYPMKCHVRAPVSEVPAG